MSEEFYRARKVRRVLRIREYDINTNKLLSKANYPISEYADYDFIVRQGKIRTMFRKNKNNFFTFDLVTFEEDIKSENSLPLLFSCIELSTNRKFAMSDSNSCKL